MVTGNYEVIKSVNISLILDALRHHGELSRSDISRITGLTTGTITNLVNKLLEYGIVEEIGAVSSPIGGRKPILLRLNPRGGYAIGIEITTTRIKAILFNLLAEPMMRLEREGSYRYHEGLEIILEIIEKFKRSLGKAENQLLGVGVSVPGWVHFSSGKIYNLPNLSGWVNVQLKDNLEQAIRLPVFVDNDANLAALGELWFGQGKNVDQLIYILVDDGIGAGFVLQHQVYHGKGYSVGELGHVSFGISDEECPCGNKGCLDVTASAKAMERTYKKLTGEEISIDQLNQRFASGDENARRILMDSAELLGRGLGSLINLYGPDTVILGGRMIYQNPFYGELLKEAALKNALPVMTQQVSITNTQLKEDSSIYGCVAMVFQSTLQPYSLRALGTHSVHLT
ncbi:ROK family protein [Microaerobacter geothermalis]|uniref:ROK family protein n=1 Tax=Microaerobacter geothermalis TaxID=674972 RepID=UPI001F3112E3|nr:ROK family protein [Microaerobacter geothermalis]MCF6094278.1 ROK family protein [Microaerobacter geothermalis]